MQTQHNKAYRNPSKTAAQYPSSNANPFCRVPSASITHLPMQLGETITLTIAGVTEAF
jgi:hypothetical protein